MEWCGDTPWKGSYPLFVFSPSLSVPSARSRSLIYLTFHILKTVILQQIVVTWKCGCSWVSSSECNMNLFNKGHQGGAGSVTDRHRSWWDILLYLHGPEGTYFSPDPKLHFFRPQIAFLPTPLKKYCSPDPSNISNLYCDPIWKKFHPKFLVLYYAWWQICSG